MEAGLGQAEGLLQRSLGQRPRALEIIRYWPKAKRTGHTESRCHRDQQAASFARNLWCTGQHVRLGHHLCSFSAELLSVLERMSLRYQSHNRLGVAGSYQ